jgi:hypothetical protein
MKQGIITDSYADLKSSHTGCQRLKNFKEVLNMDLKRSIWSVFFAGLGLGLGLGIGLGLLQAPDSGERTRRKFQKKAERIKDTMGDQLRHFNSRN